MGRQGGMEIACMTEWLQAASQVVPRQGMAALKLCPCFQKTNPLLNKSVGLWGGSCSQ